MIIIKCAVFNKGNNKITELRSYIHDENKSMRKKNNTHAHFSKKLTHGWEEIYINKEKRTYRIQMY